MRQEVDMEHGPKVTALRPTVPRGDPVSQLVIGYAPPPTIRRNPCIRAPAITVQNRME